MGNASSIGYLQKGGLQVDGGTQRPWHVTRAIAICMTGSKGMGRENRVDTLSECSPQAHSTLNVHHIDPRQPTRPVARKPFHSWAGRAPGRSRNWLGSPSGVESHLAWSLCWRRLRGGQSGNLAIRVPLPLPKITGLTQSPER